MHNSHTPKANENRQCRNLQTAIDSYFCEVGLGVNPYLVTIACRDELTSLDAQSDTDLFRIGLLRAWIPKRVFGQFFKQT